MVVQSAHAEKEPDRVKHQRFAVPAEQQLLHEIDDRKDGHREGAQPPGQVEGRDERLRPKPEEHEQLEDERHDQRDRAEGAEHRRGRSRPRWGPLPRRAPCPAR